MKMHFRHKIVQIAIATLLLSCDRNDVSPGLHKDYLGSPDHQLSYRRDFVFDNTRQLWDSYILKTTIVGDTIVDDKAYKRVVRDPVLPFVDNGSLIRLVRRDGAKYFEREYKSYQGLLDEERIFLDTDQIAGGSWSFETIDGKFEYIIDEVGATVSINNVEYNDVIKLRVNYSYLEQLVFTVIHYYAKGFGEIYGYYPIHVSGVYSDVEISLLP